MPNASEGDRQPGANTDRVSQDTDVSLLLFMPFGVSHVETESR